MFKVRNENGEIVWEGESAAGLCLALARMGGLIIREGWKVENEEGKRIYLGHGFVGTEDGVLSKIDW